MASDALLVERIPVDDEGALLGLVTMNRPDDLNPIDWDTGLALGRLSTSSPPTSRCAWSR